MSFSYSYDEEEYTGCYDTQEDAIDAALESADENDPPAEIYIGRNIDTKARLIKDSSWSVAAIVMERLEDDLRDFIGADDDILELITKDEAPSDALSNLGKEIIELVLSRSKLTRFGVERMQAWKVGKRGANDDQS